MSINLHLQSSLAFPPTTVHSLLIHTTCKANQLRTTYTHSPPDCYLMEEENMYLFLSLFAATLVSMSEALSAMFDGLACWQRWWVLGPRGLFSLAFIYFGKTKFIAWCLRHPSWRMLTGARISGTAGYACFSWSLALSLKKSWCHTSSWWGNEQIPSLLI